MSFQDLDEELDRAFVVSQSNIDAVIDPTNQDIEQLQPSFNQSINDLHVEDISPLQFNQSASLLKSVKRKSTIPISNAGVFQYLIESEKRLFEFFQNFTHRVFTLQILQSRVDSKDQFNLQDYQNLQIVRRKLMYLKDIYFQTFTSFKNVIKSYKEKMFAIQQQDNFQSDDPYEALSQQELELRRGLHEFFNFLEEMDPFTQSRAMSGSQHLTAKSPSQYELFDLNRLTNGPNEYMASFVLSSSEQEDFVIEIYEIIQDKTLLQLLQTVQKLAAVWIYIFKQFNMYEQRSSEQNYRIDQDQLSQMVLAASTLLQVPLDIYQRMSKTYNSSLMSTYSSLNLQKSLNKTISANQTIDDPSMILQQFDELLHLTALEDGLDQANKQVEEFSFSDQASEDIDDGVSEPFSQIRIQDPSPNTKQTYRQATFQMKINYTKLQDILPIKHRNYIVEAGNQWRRVCPIQINQISYRSGRPQDQKELDITTGDYFQHQEMARLFSFKPQSKIMYYWQIDKLRVTQDAVVKHKLSIKEDFGQYLQYVTARDGDVYLGTPLNLQWDKSFYKLSQASLQLIPLPHPSEAKRKYGLAILENYLYVIGGQTKQSEASATCERFNLKKQEWQSITNMGQELQSPNLFIHQDRYIVRFGGINRFGHHDKSMEMYDTRRHRWLQIKLDSDLEQINFNTGVIAIQVNSQQTLVLGGRSPDGFSDNQACVLQFIENTSHVKVKDPETIVKYYPLLQQNKTLLNFEGELDTQAHVCDKSIWVMRKNYATQKVIR